MNAPGNPTPPPTALGRIITLLLTLLGAQLVLLYGGGALPPRRAVWLAVLIGILLGPLPALAGRWQLTRLGVAAAGASVFSAACGYLYLTGVWQERAFAPLYHDEFSYLLQARMLASGRLWTAGHELADFFESFQIFTQPIYASAYFPGAAMAYAVGAILDAPTWIVPLILAGVCVVLMHRIAAVMFGEMMGLAAAVLMVGLTIFRLQSLMTMAQIPVLAAGLTLTWAYLRWRHGGAAAWAVVAGAAAGWGLVTRPVDALCFIVPVGLAVAADLFRRRASVAGTILPALAAAAPFVAVQLVFNLGVTGSLAQTPFGQYARQFYPGTQYGFHPDSDQDPATTLPQKRAYYDQIARPLVDAHTPANAARQWADARFRTTLINGVPHALLLCLLPVGLLGLRRVEIAVAAAPLAMFPLLYWPYAFFLTHYTLVCAPAVIVLTLSGIDAISRAAGRLQPAVKGAALGAVVGVSIIELPEFNRGNFDEFFRAPQVRTAGGKLSALDDGPAIVLFRWSAECNPQEEPVYNIESAGIDDHRIIRAHDLGDRNRALFAYYALRQPDRRVYRYDRSDDSLLYLGTVSQLAGAGVDGGV